MRKILLVLACVVLAGCSTEKKETSESPKSAAKKPTPEKFKVRFDTTKGTFDMDCTREWAPNGADRMYELVQQGFFDDSRFFRVIKGFMVQFGLSKDPKQNELWSQLQILDDPVKQSNKRGYVTFAKRGPNTRTTQIFINFVDNPMLDGQGFAPVCVVSDDGMQVVDKLYNVYGESIPRGNGPEQGKIMAMGNEYLTRNFPNLDAITTAKIVQ